MDGDERDYEFDYESSCETCGSCMVRQPCWQCHGKGGFHDCGEDCCVCLDKESITEDCDECDGEGWYSICSLIADGGTHKAREQGVSPEQSAHGQDDDSQACKECGAPAEWMMCWRCFGKGEACGECHGRGALPICSRVARGGTHERMNEAWLRRN